MKLRKAVEKAYYGRENQHQKPGAVAKTEPDGGQLTPKPEKKSTVPVSPKYSRSATQRINPEILEKNCGVSINPNAREIERYKILRTRIYQQTQHHKLNTIMITSAHKSEGKTVTAINMGLIFAKGMNQTVLLVDCDFKGQDVHAYLGIESRFSLIDYFLDDKPLQELIIWPGIDKLTLISGDRTVADASELLSSDIMEKLIREMGHRYEDRYVLFDAPPVLERSEAIAMARMVDGIIMVVESGVTSIKDVEKAVSLLPQDKFFGFVLNKQE